MGSQGIREYHGSNIHFSNSLVSVSHVGDSHMSNNNVSDSYFGDSPVCVILVIVI